MIRLGVQLLLERHKFMTRLFNVLVIILLLSSYSYSQTIIRQSISSYGTTSTGDAHYYAQTIGQSYNTQSSKNTKVMQGFLQPVSLKIEKVTQSNVEELELKIFPNPSQYSVTLKSSDAIKDAIILVSDVHGHIIYNQRIQSLEVHNINCSSWSTGIYLLKVQDDNNKQLVSKLIISK
ncbi:T9SS type A sorting domain-containing protein [Seonamhaeicola aphaedonensis]|uniref:Putative secreted protein (Por secretion system target) n=1 Tax=Seonamhaeicola aphaedonensis TaxID=1461338 RepID=A0A3D9HME3_9FLAO|nr:T9SS type A sorting domain-containing protein [Seonamhaeicola aphaedonensis]RED50565.1 putative secreted protein (Por secretion system target) [Seonamhaeicola aphaedonensis]